MQHPNDEGSSALPPPDPLARLEALDAPAASATSRRARRRRPSRWDRPKPPKDWRFWVGGTGRVLIATGLLLFAFVAYQLWGTAIQQAQAQNNLEDRLAEIEASLTTTTTAAPGPTSSTTPGSTATTVPPGPTTETIEIEDGDPLGFIEIPSIGVKQVLVAGVSAEDLRKGPGHYPLTPFPGELGNSAIAGHRTTYGQPFFRLDELQPGDEIIVTMVGGPRRFVYTVTGSTIVSPADYDVVLTTDPDTAILTLTTCHPRYSASQRLVVSSVLDEKASDPVGDTIFEYVTSGEQPVNDPFDTVAPDTTTTTPDTTPDTTIEGSGSTPPDPAPATTQPTDAQQGSDAAADASEAADAFDQGWFTDKEAWPQVALWGLALTAIAILSYLLSRRLRNNWIGALVGIVPFVVALYFFFENANRLLPTNL